MTERDLTVDEVAAHLRLTRRTIIEMIKDGRIEAYTVGEGAKNTQYRITAAALAAYKEQNRVKKKRKEREGELIGG